MPFRGIETLHLAYKAALPLNKVLQTSSMGRTKAMYIPTHGISEYQVQRLKGKLDKAEFATISVDMSTFSQISETGTKTKNLDIVVRFYNDVSKQVENHFLDVHFLAYETADIQKASILKSLSRFSIGLDKVIQLSRDNPNVNRRLNRLIEEEQISEVGKVRMLDTGACLIHPSHGSFKKAIGELDVEMETIIVCHHSLFKLSTVRRDKFAEKCKELGLQQLEYLEFCSTRWLVAGPCCERIDYLWDGMAAFVKDYPKEDKQITKNGVFKNLQKFYSDENIEANRCRIKFVMYTASKHEPFNAKLQTEAPIFPFLNKETRFLFGNILATVSKDDVPRTKQISKLNIKAAAKKRIPDLGPELNNLMEDLEDTKKSDLYDEFKKCLIKDLECLQSSLNFDKEVILEASYFDPDKRNYTQTKVKMGNLAHRSYRFSKQELLKLDQEIKVYIELNSNIVPEFSAKQRLDTDFYVPVWQLMENQLGYKPILFIRLTKMVLSLSHGQALVERSFR